MMRFIGICLLLAMMGAIAFILMTPIRVETPSCQTYLEFNRLAKMLKRERIALPEYCERYKDQE